MLRSIRLWVALSGAVLLLALLAASGGGALAQPNKPKSPASESVITATGRLVTETLAGDTSYLLKDSAGATLYRLEAGPPWYYTGSTYPLNKYVGKQVTVQGVVDNGNGKSNGNGKAKGKAKNKGNSSQQTQSNVPRLEVYVINGETIRGPGKPPWAGGPKSNPNHPGNNGNSNASKNKNKNSQKP